MSDESVTEIDVEVLAVSAKALLVSDGDIEAWIAFSLIDEDSEIGRGSDRGDSGSLTIPEWKAIDVGFG